MATKTERANKSDATKQAIVLPADNSIVLDDGANVSSAPELKGGVIAVLNEAGKGKDKAVEALHSIALAIMYGQARNTDFAALTFPRSIKNEKTYCVKLNAYVAEHSDVALRAAWNNKVIAGQRNRAVSLSGLATAIKPSVLAVPKESASIAQTSGNVQGEREPSADIMGTLHSVLTIVNDTIDPQRKIDAIRKLKFFMEATQAAATSRISELAAETAARQTVVTPSKKAAPKDAVSSLLAPRVAQSPTIHMTQG